MRKQKYRGITLIELLVVVTILVLLGALVVPNLTPNIETRKLREAARGVDTFLAAAKARAIRNGRPVGVLIKQAENNARAGLTLFHAEVPDVYSGDYFDHTMRLQFDGTAGTLTAVASNFLVLRTIIGQGDLIQFGGKGFLYKIETINTMGDTLTLSVDTRGAPLPWPTNPGWSNPLPFRIFRSPIIYASAYNKVGVAAASSSFFQMPEGTAIDLAGSVFPGANFVVPAAPDNTLSLTTIVFSPSGGVSAIYANQAVKYLPAGTIHLLIGKLKSIQAIAADVPPLRNWLDTTNLYVSVGHLTGQITTTEVAPVSGATNQQEEVWQATAFARDTYATGGR